MPLYDYECDSCGAKREMFLHPREIDNTWDCKCGKALRRVPLSHVAVGVDRSPGVILSNGAKVKGLFHKEAPRRRKR